jgi:hypothetical protein
MSMSAAHVTKRIEKSFGWEREVNISEVIVITRT